MSEAEQEGQMIKKDIAQLAELLDEAKRVRSNKDEYDAIAQEILRYPPQSELLQ